MPAIEESEAVVPNRFPWGYSIALVAWLAIVAGLYLLFDAHQKPRIATAAASGLARGEVVIPRSRDGHYYVAGSINGHPITFLVDTGASTVSVSPAFARQAGLPSGVATQFRTAGGTVAGEIVSGLDVEVAGIAVSGISVGVGMQTGDRQIALLGQNFLRRVEMVQAGDRMILRIRSEPNS